MLNKRTFDWGRISDVALLLLNSRCKHSRYKCDHNNMGASNLVSRQVSDLILSRTRLRDLEAAMRSLSASIFLGQTKSQRRHTWFGSNAAWSF